MGALAEFLSQARGVAVIAVPAVLQSVALRLVESDYVGTAEPQEPQGVAAELRAHLLHLADDEGVDPAHVHRLHADDVATCTGLGDETLRAYLHGLEEAARMDAGIVPSGWTATAHCAGCGPVWLWPECPERVMACPWCFRRKAGKEVRRPQVMCGQCRHYSPDPLNPAEGIGACGLGAARARWPIQGHPCGDMRPANNPAIQGDPLMISYSVSVGR